MTSRPRPIHQPHRELRSNPDETEPSFSYEQESFLPKSEDEIEDAFHNRLHARSGSFWRSSATEPSFSSMSMKQQQQQQFSASESRGSSGEGEFAASSSPVVGGLPNSWTSGGDGTTPSESELANNRRSSLSSSVHSSGGGKDVNKQRKAEAKQRTTARRLKMEAQNSDIDLGHLETDDENAAMLVPPTEGSLSRGSSSDCSPSLLYGKTLQTPRNGALLAKGSSSLIFPTGVEALGERGSSEGDSDKTRARINLALDQVEAVRFPFKKKLALENMNLVAADVPVKFLQNTSLGNSLYKLSLAGNRLSSIPPKLVLCLPALKHLDLSQCELHQLPDKWDLPQLKRLNLSHNRISEFPDEIMLEGLPELTDLNMYGNKVAEIIIPHNTKLLSRLETLNLGYNDLAYLPDELDQLKALRTLKLMRNFLERIPMRVCDMDIRDIDVSSNPLIQPPIETCERGMCSMKRYYHCLRNEEQNKNKALEEVQKKLIRQKKREERKKFRKVKQFFKSPSARPKSISEETPAPQSMLLNSHETVSEKADDSNELRIDELKENKEDVLEIVERDGKIKTREEEEALLVDEASLESKARISSAETASTTGSDMDMSSLMAMEEEVIQAVTRSDDITVNDTLKVIFVGMAMAGKTSMIKRLIEGKNATIPKRDERTVGVDIYEWDPRDSVDVDTRIEIEDKTLAKAVGDVNVKFSVWDFAGQHVYHATHELFFSPRSLYVLVWDMGATNRNTLRKRSFMDSDQGAFRLSYDSSDDEEDDDFLVEEEARRADRALERDIDEKVQFWVDCIQSSAPGAAILPVASFDDYFSQGGNEEEAERRCNVMKNRLLKHEERRIAGIKERLQEFVDENRANDEGALRLQQLLCPYTRPKLIFGDDAKNSVVRVSGTKFTGFGQLTERLVHIATGRERPVGWKYPIFRGHVGAQIPRMRLEVREAVREMRDRFKVVEWGYFVSTLRERGLTSVEDISDALHFLTNIGELSYFGNVFPDTEMQKNRSMKDDMKRIDTLSPCAQKALEDIEAEDMMVIEGDDSDMDYDDDYEERRVLLMDDTTSSTLTSTPDDGSLSTTDDFSSTGLSQYVFLNPRWLVAAVACILRHDLDREIRETRRSMERLEGQGPLALERGESFYEANLNCPVITATDAAMLWQAKKFTKKAAERAQEYSNNLSMTPFDFLQRLLIRFGVFVPIDLSIDKALLGGKEYSQHSEAVQKELEETLDVALASEDVADSASFFFLPSLLGPGEPSEAWTYKNTDSWKTTICHSILFPDGVPPGLMERITASVLSSVYAVADRDVRFRVKEILCWRTAFFLKLGTEVSRDGEEVKESVVEIFAHLVDRESHLCVGSDSMGTGMRRLILSGKGQVGDGGRKIWTGGYLLVCKAIGRVMSEYGGLEYERQGFCPECLSKKAVSQASSWDWTVIRTAGQNGDESMRCHHGHRVDTRLVAGPCDSLSKPKARRESIRNQPRFTDSEPIIPVNELLRGVVLVGLWDGRTRKIVRVGSGFIVDKKRGLIVTASHTLMNIWGDRNTPFGENYYGLREGKIVIGVIPRKKESDNDGVETKAVFRYFAKIAAKDPSIDEKGECQADVCVLRITTRMENDIRGNGEGIGDQPETLLLNNPDALKREKLQQLKVTEKCELDEQVRILGYNQGGEGLLGPGESLNRYVDFARGYVCKKFATGDDSGGYLRHRFKPLQEFVVICPTIGGHSGGPCVNQQGEVIGILSRADPAENQRCYLVPASEWKPLVKIAKNSY